MYSIKPGIRSVARNCRFICHVVLTLPSEPRKERSDQHYVTEGVGTQRDQPDPKTGVLFLIQHHQNDAFHDYRQDPVYHHARPERSPGDVGDLIIVSPGLVAEVCQLGQLPEHSDDPQSPRCQIHEKGVWMSG